MKKNETKLANLRKTFDAIDAVASNNDEDGKNLQLLRWLIGQELTGKPHMKDWQTAKLSLLNEIPEFFGNCPPATQEKLANSLYKATTHLDSYAANTVMLQPQGGLSPVQVFSPEYPNLAARALNKLGIKFSIPQFS